MTLSCHIISVTMIMKYQFPSFKEGEPIMQISRLFEIVYILMNKKSTTAKELCEHFEVSQRTIYRDIDTLCQAGIPIYTTKGKGGGIALMDNFVLNKSVLSEQEQNEILAALSGFKVATNTASNQVLHKLGALFGNKSTEWIEVDFSNWNNNEPDKNKFNLIKETILNHKVFTTIIPTVRIHIVRLSPISYCLEDRRGIFLGIAGVRRKVDILRYPE